ncbi:MAG: type II secretion system protein [Nitrosomonas sp.]|nr:type II secretion system protein [Nitrosomonas sp.]
MFTFYPVNDLQKGSIYILMLFAVTIAGILLAATGQAWHFKAQREKEKQLILVGEQFRNAVMSYYNSAADGGKKYPKTLEDLLLDKRGLVPQRHLRKMFLDPMTKSTEWGLVDEPVPEQDSGARISRSDLGIIGVYSLSKQAPIKTENFPEHYEDFTEAVTYQDWQFVYSQESEDENSEKGKEQEKSAASQSDPGSIFSSGQGASNKSGSILSPQGQNKQNQSGSSLFQ